MPQEELGSGQDGIPTPPSGATLRYTELLSAVSVRAQLGTQDFYEELQDELSLKELRLISDWLPCPFNYNTRDWVGGWGTWLQGIRYPECPKCSEPMTNVLFNCNCIDGMDEPAIVTQCPKCQDQMAFLWDLD